MADVRTWGGAVLAVLASCGAAAAESDAPWDMLTARPEALEAWKDRRFGPFICWGPVSLTGKEIGWSRGEPPWGRRPGVRGAKGPTPVEVYDNLYKTWKPDRFDARAWVGLAQEAGARYIIFLIKHHDGFCLFDTKRTDFRSTGPESAWKVDVMKHIAEAWKTFHRGTTIGESLSVTFPPVTARHVRLHLVKTTEGPSIWEFQLFGSKESPRP